MIDSKKERLLAGKLKPVMVKPNSLNDILAEKQEVGSVADPKTGFQSNVAVFETRLKLEAAARARRRSFT